MLRQGRDSVSTTKAQKAASRMATNRANYRNGLCIAWVRKNRPDVYEAIRAKAAEKYPFANDRNDLGRTALLDGIPYDYSLT
jgi:hypothetical protein